MRIHVSSITVQLESNYQKNNKNELVKALSVKQANYVDFLFENKLTASLKILFFLLKDFIFLSFTNIRNKRKNA